MLKGLNDFMDKHEGREFGSSTKAIMKERKNQGYDGGHKAKSKALKAKMGEKKGGHKQGEREAKSKKAGFYVAGHKNYGDVYEA